MGIIFLRTATVVIGKSIDNQQVGDMAFDLHKL